MPGPVGQTPESFARSLTNITPSPEKIERIESLREDFKIAGTRLFENCPPSRERSLALTAVEEAVMWAVKSIVLEGDAQ